MAAYDTPKFVVPVSLDQILQGIGKSIEELKSILGGKIRREVPMPRDIFVEPTNTSDTSEHKLTARAQCANPRVRQEWDSYSASDRRAFTDAIRCLMTRPRSGAFAAAKTRYEDMVALHQTRTPSVHGNHIFLLWHRYYLWTFEQLLRSECGFNRQLPWFDETRYSGRFAQSSVFSSDNFGSVDIGGQCVTNGQFANLAINIGPGTGNTRHCLARNGNSQLTANTNSQIVNGCNAYGIYSTMAYCAERGAHAYGHNGVGAVMIDTYASPADPVFWLHHAFIDRNFRVWQNSAASRRTSVDGTDTNGNKLTLDTVINVAGIRPDVRIRDILDTQETTLCYRYNY
ncbi:Di-copper centre-containing protein [Dothidotthia symphoricarpi CBS 119687]|uniref:Di-copper centre-containing protein n=1 Tax=Dothidotthia symphoricarpi CBS 119687 TaxID=1392245 RepID=A0A6A6A6Q1_9PLEO|nr:Di-copper centre-containing protein [Dothidotthia symphoricarpi CBS 119687]KAF2127490.1 Di-copper centre-containing protein [Dothidotthia symphoricarpi CBS 119687]